MILSPFVSLVNQPSLAGYSHAAEDFVDLLLPTVRSMEGGEEQVVAGHPRMVGIGIIPKMALHRGPHRSSDITCLSWESMLNYVKVFFFSIFFFSLHNSGCWMTLV